MNRESLRKSIIGNLGVNIINVLFPLLTIPILTRAMGAELYGHYAAELSLVVVACAIVEFGLKMQFIKLIQKELLEN